MQTFQCPQLMIHDDFLPDDILEDVIQFCTVEDYHFVHQGGKWSPSWRVRDGIPLRGSTLFYPKNFPSGTVLDVFASRLREVSNFTHQSISFTPWIYPQGTGLSIHTDGNGVYSGAFVFFLNRQWNVHNGGLLLVMDSRTKIHSLQPVTIGSQTKYLRAWLDETSEEKLVSERG